MGYIFDPDQLTTIVRRAVGIANGSAPTESAQHESALGNSGRTQLMERLVSDLAEAYPGYIETKLDWIFNISGGATGVITVLHGSISEYLILFGTPIGSEGCSGTFRIGIWDWVLDGEMWTYTDDKPLERVTTKVGEYAVLTPGQCKGWRAPGHLWMLEYGRGFVPSCIPLGLMDAATSLLDGTIIVKTLHAYGKQTIKSLLKGKI